MNYDSWPRWLVEMVQNCLVLGSNPATAKHLSREPAVIKLFRCQSIQINEWRMKKLSSAALKSSIIFGQKRSVVRISSGFKVVEFCKTENNKLKSVGSMVSWLRCSR